VFPPALVEKLYTPHSEEEFVVRGLPSARDIAVHGCGTAAWVKKDFPKGEHKGFIKWIKSSANARPYDPPDEDRDLDFDDEPVEMPVEPVPLHVFEEAAAAQLAIQPIPVAAREVAPRAPIWRFDPPAGWDQLREIEREIQQNPQEIANRELAEARDRILRNNRAVLRPPRVRR
jgi:hypothetical protein